MTESVDVRLARMEGKVDSLKSGIEELKAELVSFRSTCHSCSQDLTKNTTEIESLKERMDKLEEKQGKDTNAIWNRLWYFAGGILLAIGVAVIGRFIK